MRQLRMSCLVIVAGLLAAACSVAGAQRMLEELGDGEGELNLVIWAGYAEDGSAYPEFDWVTPFEEETGCIVNSTVMADSANGVQLLRSGEYDGGSFSGNATDRLMAAGDVAPVNVELLPNYANVFEGLKLQPHNSLDGVPTGAPRAWSEPPGLEHRRGRRTDHPERALGGRRNYEGLLSIFDSPDFIADAALHLMATAAGYRDHEPVPADPGAVRCGHRPARGAVHPQPAVLERRDLRRPDHGVRRGRRRRSARPGSTRSTAWLAEGAPVEAVKPAEGATGWSDTWMISTRQPIPTACTCG